MKKGVKCDFGIVLEQGYLASNKKANLLVLGYLARNSYDLKEISR